MSIRALPEDVVRLVRSSATVTSLNAVACALVRNSLDSGATRLNITIDYSRGNCTVEDDGLGILPCEFRETGGLCKHHHTSKYSSEHECHGVHGNFLASVAALSLLTITSRHHLHNSHNSLTIHNSRTLARNTPALPEQRLVAFTHGTRVTVRNLFGSMPVRVKQRAAACEKSVVDKEWSRLVHDVAALLLAWPPGVALFLRDAVGNSETRFRPYTISGSDMVSHASRTLAQSGLVDSLDQASWTPIGASMGNWTIEGCISLNPVATRRAQFISFGIRPLNNEHGTHVLYNEVNRIFTQSAFAIEENAVLLSDSPLAVLPTSRESAGSTARLKRGLDRWPMFYFRINSTSQTALPLGCFFEHLDNRNHALADVTDLLKLVCYEFLKKHHFRPHKVTTSLRGSSGQKKRDELGTAHLRGEAKRSRTVSLPSNDGPNSVTPISRSDSPFFLWKRVKVGRVMKSKEESGLSIPVSSNASRAKTVVSLTKRDSRMHEAPQPSLHFLDGSGNLLRKPFENLETNILRVRTEPKERSCAHSRSAASDERFSSYLHLPAHTLDDGQTPPRESFDAAQASSTLDGEPVSVSALRSVDDLHTRQKPSEWLKELISKWENPVFQSAELPIPRLCDAPIGRPSRASVPSLDLDAGCSHATPTSNIKLSGRISKAALVDAEVVSQVDQKFILVKLRPDQVSDGRPFNMQPISVLVLIDQHAADERCRLEALMRDYFCPVKGSKEVVARTEVLEKPLRFEFSAKECQLLRKYSHQLRRWGIIYQVEEPKPVQWPPKGKSLSQVDMTSLPPSILERCQSEPRLLADLLRQEIWRAEEEGASTAQPASLANGGHHREIDWVSNFHGCPPGILNLLNSRSCRSAIMFNDVLSRHECESLVFRLSGCLFPFQCAHGRPSMVPLADMRSLDFNREIAMDTFGSRLKQSGLTKKGENSVD